MFTIPLKYHILVKNQIVNLTKFWICMFKLIVNTLLIILITGLYPISKNNISISIYKPGFKKFDPINIDIPESISSISGKIYTSNNICVNSAQIKYELKGTSNKKGTVYSNENGVYHIYLFEKGKKINIDFNLKPRIFVKNLNSNMLKHYFKFQLKGNKQKEILNYIKNINKVFIKESYQKAKNFYPKINFIVEYNEILKNYYSFFEKLIETLSKTFQPFANSIKGIDIILNKKKSSLSYQQIEQFHMWKTMYIDSLISRQQLLYPMTLLVADDDEINLWEILKICICENKSIISKFKNKTLAIVKLIIGKLHYEAINAIKNNKLISIKKANNVLANLKKVYTEVTSQFKLYVPEKTIYLPENLQGIINYLNTWFERHEWIKSELLISSAFYSLIRSSKTLLISSPIFKKNNIVSRHFIESTNKYNLEKIKVKFIENSSNLFMLFSKVMTDTSLITSIFKNLEQRYWLLLRIREIILSVAGNVSIKTNRYFLDYFEYDSMFCEYAMKLAQSSNNLNQARKIFQKLNEINTNLNNSVSVLLDYIGDNSLNTSPILTLKSKIENSKIWLYITNDGIIPVQNKILVINGAISGSFKIDNLLCGKTIIFKLNLPTRKHIILPVELRFEDDIGLKQTFYIISKDQVPPEIKLTLEGDYIKIKAYDEISSVDFNKFQATLDNKKLTPFKFKNTILYKLPYNLSTGKHNLKVKIADICGNIAVKNYQIVIRANVFGYIRLIMIWLLSAMFAIFLLVYLLGTSRKCKFCGQLNPIEAEICEKCGSILTLSKARNFAKKLLISFEKIKSYYYSLRYFFKNKTLKNNLNKSIKRLGRRINILLKKGELENLLKNENIKNLFDTLDSLTLELKKLKKIEASFENQKNLSTTKNIFKNLKSLFSGILEFEEKIEETKSKYNEHLYLLGQIVLNSKELLDILTASKNENIIDELKNVNSLKTELESLNKILQK